VHNIPWTQIILNSKEEEEEAAIEGSETERNKQDMD